MRCFSSLSYYTACCPNHDVATPAQAGCPEEYLNVECCPREDFLGLVKNLPPSSHLQAQELLWSFLRDIDLESLEAWKLFSAGSARHANLQMSEFHLTETGASKALLEEGRSLSRLLGRSILRLESFQQFCMWKLATQSGRQVVDVEPEACEHGLHHLYIETVANHDRLAYSLLTQHSPHSAPRVLRTVVALQIVCTGKWAKKGTSTLVSLLRRRTTSLRIFVLGDVEGWEDLLGTMKELSQAHELDMTGIGFEHINFEQMPEFQRYMHAYPQDCFFDSSIERAMLARILCPLLLPEDVEQVISIDLGDILILDDIYGLWEIGWQLREHFLAAAYAAPLHHINAGTVVYNLKRMRDSNFTDLTLLAAEHGLRTSADGECLRDQGILNILNDEAFLANNGFREPVLGFLPCRWSLFPSLDWHPAWEKLELWPAAMIARHRYPGIVSRSQVEHYCPDAADLLSSFAFVPLTGSRQARVREYAALGAEPRARYCSSQRLGEPCCTCGEPAALVHVAGDLKKWPGLRQLLQTHVGPTGDSLLSSEGTETPTSRWWSSESRGTELRERSQEHLYKLARQRGLNYVMRRGSALCHTFATRRLQGVPRYHETRLGKLFAPLVLSIDTTSTRFQLRFLEAEWSMEFAVQLATEPVVRLWWQGANGTRAVAESLRAHACSERSEWISTRWSLSPHGSEIDICDGKTEFIQHEVPLREATAPFSLLVGSEAEALWSVCLN